jgi:ribonuclease BN (tRNA processing enzyme)
MNFATIDGGRPIVDVLCLTHVDDDHVVGVIRLLKELRQSKSDGIALPIDLRRVWFNSVDDLIDKAEPGLAASVHSLMAAAPFNEVVAASYTQGQDVRTSVNALNLEGNKPFGCSLTVGSAKKVDSLSITVVGPGTDALAALAEKWRASVQSKNTESIASAYADRSVPNLSSIALYLSYEGRTALLTGDARGDELLIGMEEAGVLKKGETIHVDVFKLPHHGSENNVTKSLFERLRADHYVVCADGIKHKHPSVNTLKWLVDSRTSTDSYTIHLTNSIPVAEKELTELSKGRNFTISVGDPRVDINLEPLCVST